MESHFLERSFEVALGFSGARPRPFLITRAVCVCDLGRPSLAHYIPGFTSIWQLPEQTRLESEIACPLLRSLQEAIKDRPKDQ